MNEALLAEIDKLSISRGESLIPLYSDMLGEEEQALLYALSHQSFFTDPASGRYHGSWKGGLAQHSLRVLHHVLRLYPLFCLTTDKRSMVLGTLLHDLCKLGSYEIQMRNVKDDTGVWIKQPFFANKPDLVTVGHGAESCRRIEKLGIELTEGWYMAVRWHMGAYDATDTDKYGMMAAMKKYPEVLLLQTADLMAGIEENI